MISVEGLDLKETTVIVHSGVDRDHNVGNIHNGFLVSRGVISRNWEQDEYESFSTYVELTYKNGISIYMDEDYLRVAQIGSREFGGKHEPIEFLTRYLVSVESDTLGGSTLRWVIELPQDDPSHWIGARFIIPEAIMLDDWESSCPQVSFNFEIQGQSAFCTFFTGYEVDDSGEEQGYINISCGIRQRPFGSNDELIGWLSSWREHEEFMLQTISLLCGGDSDDRS